MYCSLNINIYSVSKDFEAQKKDTDENKTGSNLLYLLEFDRYLKEIK